jgi:CheY-like chemotaxis protein
MSVRLKVLVVDDDQLNLEMIGAVLTTEKVDVLGLRDPREAARRIEKEQFDGIFLDLTMPAMSGLELAKLIRGSLPNSNTPIVVITGRADSGDAMKEAFAAGSHFFLSKPLDVGKLRRLVNTAHGTFLRERRRSHRAPMDVPVTCRMGNRSFTGVTSLISEQDLIFQLHFQPGNKLAPGDLMHVSFTLPTSPAIVETMVVIRRADDRDTIGQFQSLNPATQKAVQEFVASFDEMGAAASLPKKTTTA